MNFDDMPELKFKYGYFVVLALIFVVCSMLYRMFPAGEMALKQAAIRSGAAPSGWRDHPCR